MKSWTAPKPSSAQTLQPFRAKRPPASDTLVSEVGRENSQIREFDTVGHRDIKPQNVFLVDAVAKCAHVS